MAKIAGHGVVIFGSPGLVFFVAAVFVWRDSQVTVELYLKD
jgi:hypothetical protein